MGGEAQLKRGSRTLGELCLNYDYLAHPGVTFASSFFGGSPLHKRKGIPLPTRGFRGALQKNDTCFYLVLLCMGSLRKCHFRTGATEVSPVHKKLLALKGHFDSDTWTR